MDFNNTLLPIRCSGCMTPFSNPTIFYNNCAICDRLVYTPSNLTYVKCPGCTKTPSGPSDEEVYRTNCSICDEPLYTTSNSMDVRCEHRKCDFVQFKLPQGGNPRNPNLKVFARNQEELFQRIYQQKLEQIGTEFPGAPIDYYEAGQQAKCDTMDILGYKRYCCRASYMCPIIVPRGPLVAKQIPLTINSSVHLGPISQGVKPREPNMVPLVRIQEQLANESFYATEPIEEVYNPNMTLAQRNRLLKAKQPVKSTQIIPSRGLKTLTRPQELQLPPKPTTNLPQSEQLLPFVPTKGDKRWMYAR